MAKQENVIDPTTPEAAAAVLPAASRSATRRLVKKADIKLD